MSAATNARKILRSRLDWVTARMAERRAAGKPNQIDADEAEALRFALALIDDGKGSRMEIGALKQRCEILERQNAAQVEEIKDLVKRIQKLKQGDLCKEQPGQK